MLNAVEHAKKKMLEHRGKAEAYERYARAYACATETVIRLSIDDINFFGLGGGDV